MGFWALLEVASMPILQFLIVALLGAFLASGYCNVLSANVRRDINTIVFYVFCPSLVFTSLSKTVTLHDIISWWFMPVNIAITFLIGTIIGWLIVKILKPKSGIENLVIACCSAGNLGNLLLIIIPAICKEDNNPFGDPRSCNDRALSYVSLSLALGAFYIWTHSYSLMKRMNADYGTVSKATNIEDEELGLPQSSSNLKAPLLSSGNLDSNKVNCWSKIKGILHQIAEEILSPITIAALVGFVVGVIPWLKSLIIGATAPLRVVQDSVTLLGDGNIPCVTLILGGNLTKGLRKSPVRPSIVIGIVLARYLLLPAAGIAVVKAAAALGFLPQDLLFHYVLLIQFALPPAMAIGTMAQLFGVGQEECSVIFLWTYLVAAPALTIWSTIFMYILS